MYYQEVLEQIKDLPADQQVALVFAITAHEVVNGNFEELFHHPDATLADHIALNRLNVLIDIALRFPGVTRTSPGCSEVDGGGVYSAIATRQTWKDLFSYEFPPSILASIEAARNASLRPMKPNNPFTERGYVHITIRNRAPV